MLSLRSARRPARSLSARVTFAENFERVPESAVAARRLLALALDAWDLGQLADSAVLVLSELVSNAVRHASGEGMRVTVTRVGAGRVRVAVLDRSRSRPRVQDPDLGAERGRGLVIVSAEATSWGVDLLPGGKRVWADLAAGAA